MVLSTTEPSSTDIAKRLRAVVELLCSDDFQPRNTGSLGAVRAASYLASEMEALGLESAGSNGFLQEIPPINGANVLGAIRGRTDRWVILAAHFDACGWENPGAGDNAAGVAIALEVARRLHADLVDHSILFALFDSEEPPNFLNPEMGSQWFVDRPTIPLDRVDTMVCLDVVGHALGTSLLPDSIRDSVFVLGAEKGSGTAQLLDSLSPSQGVVPRRIDSYIVPAMSDYYAFTNASIPFLFYTCGRNIHYHEPTDTPETLDYRKMADLTDHLVLLMRTLGDRADRPIYLADAVDDAATVRTILELTETLSPFASDADRVRRIVDPLKERVSGGSLTDHDRRTVAHLVFTIEEALA